MPPRPIANKSEARSALSPTRKEGGEQPSLASTTGRPGAACLGEDDVGRHQSGAALAICASLFLASATDARAEVQGQFAFNLPAEDLPHAIREFAAVTGQNVIAADELVRS